MSDVVINPMGSSPTPALSLVTADDETIEGNGTSVNPLRLKGSGVNSFDSTTPNHAETVPGGVVHVTGDDTTDTSIADGSSAAAAFATGLIKSVGAPGINRATTIQTSGPLTLTTAQWDTITGGSGGLTPGPYWVSATTAGRITATKPVATGTYATLVGNAIDATTMIIQPSAPIGPHA